MHPVRILINLESHGNYLIQMLKPNLSNALVKIKNFQNPELLKFKFLKHAICLQTNNNISSLHGKLSLDQL